MCLFDRLRVAKCLFSGLSHELGAFYAWMNFTFLFYSCNRYGLDPIAAQRQAGIVGNKLNLAHIQETMAAGKTVHLLAFNSL